MKCCIIRFTWEETGALTVTLFSAVAGSRTVSLTGCCVWKSCAQRDRQHPPSASFRMAFLNCESCSASTEQELFH